MYCKDKQLITKKEKKRFEERNEILRLYNMGMSFEDLLDRFGRTRKRYIKRIILEESFMPEDGPGIIPNYRNTKLKKAQKDFIDQLVGDENYIAGLRDTTERLIYHDNPKIQVNVTQATVRKYLNRDYVMKDLNILYENQVNQTKKVDPDYQKQKEDQAKRIGI